MKTLIKIEEAALFGLCIWLFSNTDFAWWCFPLLILAPDISMLGYLIGDKAGAILYNLFHHKGVAILIFFLGFYLNNEIIILSGIILLAHSCLDRVLGYGLKYFTGFQHTHLGDIGKGSKSE